MNSPSHSDRQSPAWHWLLLVLIGGVRFLNLGFIDLQAWDEALYAVRSRGILLFGGWVDQTSFAVDGLYSSLHPPLHVWLTAFSFQLFGPGEASARLVSAFAGALTIPILYAIGRKWMNSSVGLFAALLFGLNPFVTFFARQGQFDTLLVFFLTVSVYCILEAQRTHNWTWPLLSGAAIGCALMTKLFVAMGIPLAYAIWAYGLRRVKIPRAQETLLGLIGISVLVAVPWHLFMSFQHGDGNLLFFLHQSALVDRTITGIEGNVKPLEVLYFVNQMFVLFPFGAAWFLFGLSELRFRTDDAGTFLAAWFLVFFVVFSFIRTKLSVYLLPLLIPASLIASKELWKAVSGKTTPARQAGAFGATLVFVLWSSSQTWRSAAKEVLSSLFSAHFPSLPSLLHSSVFGMIMLFIIGATIVALDKGYLERFRTWIPAILFFPLGILAGYQTVVADRFQYNDGATDLQHFVRKYAIRQIVVAGHERNPQLSWYFEGADLGWRDDLHIRRIIPPQDSLRYTEWLDSEMNGELSSSLLVIEKDKFVRYKTVNPVLFVSPQFRPVFESRRYSAFVRSPSDFLAETSFSELSIGASR